MLLSREGEPTMPAFAFYDYIGSEEPRRRPRRERDGRVSARLIAIANTLEGPDRASAARLARMDREMLRDWVPRYHADGIAGLCNWPALGRKPKLTERQMAALKGWYWLVPIQQWTKSQHDMHPAHSIPMSSLPLCCCRKQIADNAPRLVPTFDLKPVVITSS